MDCLGRRIELHGWDSHAQAWHGPDELTFTLRGCRRILAQLRQVPGSWYGRLRAELAGEPPLSVCASVHDLGDSGLAVIDVEGSPGGPLEVVLAVPAHRRPQVRPELAFEFVAFLRFLEGRTSLGSEQALHDYVHSVLAEPAGPPSTLIFTIETRAVTADTHLLISQQAEKLAMSMLQWMAEKDGCLPA